MSRKAEPAYITEKGAFPSNLRELMEERQTTQKKLADVIGMRPQTVSLYVTGQSVPDINCLNKIAEFFNVSADWLIGRPNCPKAVNADARAVMKYTGLSEAAVSWLNSLRGEADKLRLISALIEHGVFHNVLGDICQLEEAQVAAEMERWQVNPVAEGWRDGGYIIPGYEYYSLLEYRISEQLKLVIDEITRPPLDDKGGD